MLRQLLREYPDLGSFWYGHWEDVELTPLAFLILMKKWSLLDILSVSD